jgi:hypothetical protein
MLVFAVAAGRAVDFISHPREADTEQWHLF